jgi:hypothetical protein
VTRSFPSGAVKAGWPFSDLWRATETRGRAPGLEDCHFIGTACLTMLSTWNQASGRARSAIGTALPSRIFDMAKERVVSFASSYWKHQVTGHSK